MKSIILVALALVAVAVASPVSEVPKIVRQEFEQSPEGGYKYVFETDDGTARQEEGQLKEVFDEDNKPHQVVIVRGTYSYKNADGSPESIVYIADQNGFHAEGDSIPKAPARR